MLLVHSKGSGASATSRRIPGWPDTAAKHALTAVRAVDETSKRFMYICYARWNQPSMAWLRALTSGNNNTQMARSIVPSNVVIVTVALEERPLPE